jgi:hypothetical protein
MFDSFRKNTFDFFVIILKIKLKILVEKIKCHNLQIEQIVIELMNRSVYLVIRRIKSEQTATHLNQT